MNLSAVSGAGGRAARPRPAARAVRLVNRGHLPLRTPVLVLAVPTAAAALTAGCGGSSAASGAPSAARALQGRVLSAADLPAGWSAVPARPQSTQTDAACLPARRSHRQKSRASDRVARSQATPDAHTNRNQRCRSIPYERRAGSALPAA